MTNGRADPMRLTKSVPARKKSRQQAPVGILVLGKHRSGTSALTRV
jgi:hypothetical protein